MRPTIKNMRVAIFYHSESATVGVNKLHVLSNKRPPWRSLLPLNTFIDCLVVVGKSAVFANTVCHLVSIHSASSSECGQFL